MGWACVVVFAHDCVFGMCEKVAKVQICPGTLSVMLKVFFFSVDTTGPHNAAVTKAVYGVCVDPHDGHRIASFAEVGNVTVEQSQYL